MQHLAATWIVSLQMAQMVRERSIERAEEHDFNHASEFLLFARAVSGVITLPQGQMQKGHH